MNDDRLKTLGDPELWVPVELSRLQAGGRADPHLAVWVEVGRLIDTADTTQAELAERLEASQPVVSRWRSFTTSPPRHWWPRIEDVFELPSSYFVDLWNSTTPASEVEALEALIARTCRPAQAASRANPPSPTASAAEELAPLPPRAETALVDELAAILLASPRGTSKRLAEELGTNTARATRWAQRSGALPAFEWWPRIEALLGLPAGWFGQFAIDGTALDRELGDLLSRRNTNERLLERVRANQASLATPEQLTQVVGREIAMRLRGNHRAVRALERRPGITQTRVQRWAAGDLTPDEDLWPVIAEACGLEPEFFTNWRDARADFSFVSELEEAVDDANDRLSAIAHSMGPAGWIRCDPYVCPAAPGHCPARQPADDIAGAWLADPEGRPVYRFFTGRTWTDTFRAPPEVTEPCRAGTNERPVSVDLVIIGLMAADPRADVDLAAALDVDVDAVAAWRAGAPVPFDLWPGIEAAYHLDPGELATAPIGGSTLDAHLAGLETVADQLDLDLSTGRLNELRAGLEAVDRIVGRTPDRSLAGRYAVLVYRAGRAAQATPPIAQVQRPPVSTIDAASIPCPDTLTIPERLAELLAEAGHGTGTRLAEHLGVHPGRVSRWKGSRDVPPARHWAAIDEFFGLPSGHLASLATRSQPSGT